MNRRSAFTLTELLVALAVGLVVVQIAFASFFIVRKYVNRIQRLEAATNILQAAVTWYGYHGPPAVPLTDLPQELQWSVATGDYVASFDVPSVTGAAKIRSLPHRIVGNIDISGRLTIYDLSNDANGAKERGEERGITGWKHPGPTPDPRFLAEIQLP